MIPFQTLYRSRCNTSKIMAASERLLALDPGETTGYAVFNTSNFIRGGQLSTSDPQGALIAFTELFDQWVPTMVVMEEYRVYAHKTAQHAGSSLSTPRLIGMLETLCHQRAVPYHKQGAGIAKGFVKNDHLRAWEMWSVGMKHALDATRHGAYFILFPPKIVESQQIVHTKRTTGRHVG